VVAGERFVTRPSAGRGGATEASVRRLAALHDTLVAALAGLPGRVEQAVPLESLTTYHLGGPVAVLVRVGSAEALAAVVAVVAEPVADQELAVLVVGRGSNLLVADAGFAGLGLVLEGEFEAVTFGRPDSGEPAPATVHAGAAVPLPVLARRAAAAGARGLGFFVGIPGSVGGAVRMNAGGHGRETADVLVDAEIADLSRARPVEVKTVEALGLGYRRSALTATEVVVGATFSVEAAAVAACEQDLADVVRWRREHQPGGANAGSVFANPPEDSAGRLIDAAGLKGLRVGGAVVSEKHANFFQAEPGAVADDVYRLVREVQRRVQERFGVVLQPELRLVGFDALAAEDPR
jgi:UDP-N-acetylmuramate dehydrogenase